MRWGNTRRRTLGAIVGAVIAVPLSFGFASLGLAQDSGPAGVPASDCPEAVAQLEEWGAQPVERFVPDCPAAGEFAFEAPVPPEDVLDMDAGCDKVYGNDEAFGCPATGEVNAAEAEVEDGPDASK